MEGLLLNARTISVSFVTDVGRPSVSVSTGGSVSTPSNPTGAQDSDVDPVLGGIHKSILRLQVTQVVLGLSLMVISTVAILEDRVLFGLGFGVISAVVAVSSAVIGIKEENLKTASIWIILAIIFLLPSVFFVFEDLIRHAEAYTGRTHPLNIQQEGLATAIITHHQRHLGVGGGKGWSERMASRSAAFWILGWLELAHLITLFVILIFLLFLYRYLNYYRHHF